MLQYYWYHADNGDDEGSQISNLQEWKTEYSWNRYYVSDPVNTSNGEKNWLVVYLWTERFWKWVGSWASSCQLRDWPRGNVGDIIQLTYLDTPCLIYGEQVKDKAV